MADYTLSHPSPDFIHQYIVDAYAAQNANEQTKSIALTFALIGLYLNIEKKYTGREVQLAHMQMAKNRKDWPTFELPENRGEITISNVLETPPGIKRDQVIQNWCICVWKAYSKSHPKVADLAKKELKWFWHEKI